jgi:exodeoxyribonuclease V alpha subunit
MYGLIQTKEKKTFFDSLLDMGVFSYIDLFFAERILETDFNEAEALCLSYLFFISRKGHLCLEKTKDSFSPSLDILLEGKEIQDFSFMAPLFEKIQIGFKLLSQKHKINENNISKNPIIFFENKLYLQKNWFSETLLLENIKRLINSRPESCFEEEKLKNSIDKMIAENKLTEEQGKSILQTNKKSLSLICGGPGTGKTYIASCIATLFISSLKEGKKPQIVIAAPTGKATTHLESKIHASLPSSTNFSISALTLHALLGVRRKKKQKKIFLPYDLFLIDESSMIDLNLMNLLFQLIKPGARLVLMGDPDQLPSVEAGNIFFDLLLSLKQEKVVSSLSRGFRFEENEINTFVQAIKNEESQKALQILKTSKKNLNFSFLKEEKTFSVLLEKAKKFFPLPSDEELDPLDLMQQMEAFRILCCFRQGFYGCENINEKIFDEIQSTCKIGQYLAIPIIITKNDYQLEVFNGTIGIAIGKKQGQESFFSNFYGYFWDYKNKSNQKLLKKIPLCLLHSYELAYCLTIHKSQGSEFKNIFAVFPKGSQSFGKQMLYTAATRAKKHLEIVSEEKIIEEIIGNNIKKTSGIISRLKNK